MATSISHGDDPKGVGGSTSLYMFHESGILCPVSKVTLIKPHQRSANTAQTPGMIRQAGIYPEMCQNDGLWMGFVSTPAATASGAHHHGDAESGIYMLRGRIRFYFGDKLEESIVAEAGDFIFVPPLAVHVEENLSPDEPVDFIVSRNSTTMMVVNVPDPRERAKP